MYGTLGIHRQNVQCHKVSSSLILVVDIGIYIEQGLYIARIVPGSTVAKEGMLSTGDRIICVSTGNLLTVCAV